MGATRGVGVPITHVIGMAFCLVALLAFTPLGRAAVAVAEVNTCVLNSTAVTLPATFVFSGPSDVFFFFFFFFFWWGCVVPSQPLSL